MNRSVHHRIVAVALAMFWICASTGCVSNGPNLASSFPESNAPSATIPVTDRHVQAASAKPSSTMPGSLQAKLAQPFRRLGIRWYRPGSPLNDTVEQDAHSRSNPSPLTTGLKASELATDNKQATEPTAGQEPVAYVDPTTGMIQDDRVQPAAYEQVPGEKHYANPVPLSRDAEGLLPGDPYAPSPVMANPYGPFTYPGPPYPAGTVYGPPWGPSPMPPINQQLPDEGLPANMDGASRFNPAYPTETPSPTPAEFDGGHPDANHHNPSAPNAEELPLPMPLDDPPLHENNHPSTATPPIQAWPNASPQRTQPNIGHSNHSQYSHSQYTFGDQRSGAATSGLVQNTASSWDDATMTGRGYLADGSAMHGSQLRSTPLTATEIALQLKQENETLRERMQFAEAAQHRAENRLSAVENELSNLRRELAEAKQSIARLSVANRKLDQQLAAERAEKERLRQHSDAALRNIEETLDTVLLNTISPRK